MTYVITDECPDVMDTSCSIGRDSAVDDDTLRALDDNARFFTETLPCRSEPQGNPRGALHVGTEGDDIAWMGAVR